MKTVHEVSALTGVSIRTLQYYDKIGLLPATGHTEAGYRLYDEAALERLGHILLFRELQFPLKDIQEILDSPDFDRKKALTQQIELLTLQKERIEGLITLARSVRDKEERKMSFEAFDKKKMEDYAARAKASWGETKEYKEYEEKHGNRPEGEEKALAGEMMDIFVRLNRHQGEDPAAPEVQALVKELQDFISEHYYQCSKEILSSLGKAYGAGGEFTQNIDRAAGEGAGAFASAAVEAFCKGE